MPWIPPKEHRATRWRTITIKAQPDLVEALEQFRKEAGLGNISDTCRFLLAAGLDSHWSTQKHVISAIQSNAKAQAMYKFSQLLDQLMITYRDPAYRTEDE